MPEDRYDVAIMGGGLAGLTLGLQLKNARPETSVFIAEKRKGPAPLAAFKVGESTVEMSAHYFADVVGMRDHLESEQLPKAGLRFFFPAGDNSDITQRVEWGATSIPPVSSFQVDRGLFENALATRNEEAGNDLIDGTRILDVDLESEGDHTVRYERDGDETAVRARWVVDATGITSIIKKKLDLHKPVEHNINSAWLRLGGGLDIDDWGRHDAEWLGRMESEGVRGLSTNHLMGEGYWCWLIPLSSGAISIGVVADPRFHAFEEISTLDAAIDWLKRHEPQLGNDIDSRRDDVQDFLKVENFAYSCQRVFSPDRWALTGIAGVFADPFYSPGSDFIAQGNTMITELVTADLGGEDIRKMALGLNAQYLTIFETAIRGTYTNHYQLFGNAQVMSSKILWEFAAYWVLAALPFMQGVLTDPEFNAEVSADNRRMLLAGSRMEQMFRDWHELGQREWRGAFIANKAWPDLYQLHLDLGERFDRETLKRKWAQNADLLEGLAVVIFAKAAEQLPDATLDPEQPINPAAISLDPSRWEKDGLFKGAGISLNEARARTAGVEPMLLDELIQPV